MHRGRVLLVLALLGGAGAPAPQALAQKPAAQKPVHDQYLPSRVLRNSRENCLRDEEAIGAFCVKACRQGYDLVPNSNPPRCRSIKPLPPGSQPGPLRQETGRAHKPPPRNTKPAPGE